MQSYIDLLPGASRAEYTEEDAGYTLALEAFKKRVRGVEELPIVENYVEPEAVMKTVRASNPYSYPYAYLVMKKVRASNPAPLIGGWISLGS